MTMTWETYYRLACFESDDGEGIINFKYNSELYMREKLAKPFTLEQFNSVFNYAWEEGHAAGYDTVAVIFNDILKIVKAFMP